MSPAIHGPSGAPPDDPRGALEFIRWYGELVVRLVENYTAQAIRYLIFANAGGAVALLTFIGTAQELRAWPGAWDSLATFVQGLILVGVVTALNFFSAMYIALRLAARGSMFTKGRIRFDQIADVPKWFVWSVAIPIVLGLWSFGLFVSGAITGVGGFQQYVQETKRALVAPPPGNTDRKGDNQ